MNISELMGHYCSIGILDTLIQISWLFPSFLFLGFFMGIITAIIWRKK